MKPRYKLVLVRRQLPTGVCGWLVSQYGMDYYDPIVRDMRHYVPLRGGGVMVLKPLEPKPLT